MDPIDEELLRDIETQLFALAPKANWSLHQQRFHMGVWVIAHIDELENIGAISLFVSQEALRERNIIENILNGVAQALGNRLMGRA